MDTLYMYNELYMELSSRNCLPQLCENSVIHGQWKLYLCAMDNHNIWYMYTVKYNITSYFGK